VKKRVWRPNPSIVITSALAKRLSCLCIFSPPISQNCELFLVVNVLQPTCARMSNSWPPMASHHTENCGQHSSSSAPPILT
jgi:hypothetical protein